MTMCVSSNTTNEQHLCDSLGKITWVREDFLSQGKISYILIRCARMYFLIITLNICFGCENKKIIFPILYSIRAVPLVYCKFEYFREDFIFAKHRKIKPSQNGKITLLFIDLGEPYLSREFFYITNMS